jgi:NurA-like 5'-3' nuclease
MESFQDSVPNTWCIDITIGVNERVFKPLGFDLMDADSRVAELSNVMRSMRSLMDLIYGVLEKEIKSNESVQAMRDANPEWSLSDCFWEQFDGEQTIAATEAMAKEIANFIRETMRNPTTAKVIEATTIRQRSTTVKAAVKVAKMMETSEMDTKIEKELDKAISQWKLGPVDQ